MTGKNAVKNTICLLFYDIYRSDNYQHYDKSHFTVIVLFI